MAGEARNDFHASEVRRFNACRDALNELVYEDTDESKKCLKNLLDELIAIEYSLKLANEQVIGEILTKCCNLVPLKHDVLVTKVCHLASNMLSKQQLIMDHGVEIFTEYLIQALKTCQGWTYSDILRALGVVLYENGGKLGRFHSTLLGANGYLLQLAKVPEHDIVRGAMQCIENICIRTPNHPYLAEEYHNACLRVLLETLQTPKPATRDSIIHARIIISGLRGINCIVINTKTVDSDNLGPLLAALKVYMLFGLPGMSFAVPQSLVPTPLSKYDPAAKDSNTTADAVNTSTGRSEVNRDETNNNSKPSKAKWGKKRRGHGKKTDKHETGIDQKQITDGMSKMSTVPDRTQDASSGVDASASDFFSTTASWSKLSSSDSEFSESEGGQSSKLRMLQCRIRQCALSCFYGIVKAVDKRSMFGYWPSFIPDTPGAAGPTLFTGVMKDPSPKARTGALTVLTALVDGSKQYLMAAEESDQYRNAPFTPFSVNLGHMIKEIHRCLLLALVSETSPLAITQIIKCLATLIPNVPYQRLRPGLLTRVLKQIFPFINHRDPNVRVACLTCLGSMAKVQAPLMEVVHLFQRPPSVRSSNGTGVKQRMSETLESASSRKNSDSGYQSTNNKESMDSISLSDSPQVATPRLLSGTQSPSIPDPKLHSSGDSNISWVIRLCVANVTPHLLEESQNDDKDSATPRVLPPADTQPQVHPLPVRLESLQNLAAMARNYFFLLRPCLFMMRDVGYCCLEDPDPVLKLHGTKLLEELGAVILQQYNDNVEDRPSLQVMTDFWMPLLNGPLPKALQTVDYIAVKSTVCDCLATIGPQIFARMPVDKRILCITLMLGLCDDADHHVRSPAVRALGVYVLYPCLREDVNFVADVANCIIKALQEQQICVRVKASWSLGNLSDALVSNRTDNDEAFVEEFPDMLLLKLFEAGIQASRDNDKVKSSAVRALGNLLRYVPKRCLESSKFHPIIETAIQALVKNIGTGSMKVRWNACYAIGKMFSNPVLPVGDSSWTESIFEALCSVIKNCKNFKVRINAALAFSVLTSRHTYGTTAQYCTIWQSLVTSLESAETITDFAEYRYRGNLTEQVCSSLVHMFTFLELPDLKLFCETMQSHHQCLCIYMEQYTHILLEKEEDDSKVLELVKARDIARQLAELDVDDQISSYLFQYIDLFTMKRPEPPLYDESQITTVNPPKSGFKQTYD